MINFLIIANKQAKLRISRFFSKCDRKVEIQRDIVKACLLQNRQEGLVDDGNNLAVYRHYANLVFIVGITDDENELACLELIQNFVETMQKYFNKVSEMDILFNMDRVHFIIDEMISNGCVSETSKNRILVPLQLIDASKK